MFAVRLALVTLCLSALAFTSAAQTNDQRPIAATTHGTINFDSEANLTPERMTELLVGQRIRPLTRLEFSSEDSIVTILSLADFQQFCAQQLTPSHQYLVFIDNQLAGMIRQLPSFYRAPNGLYTHEYSEGRLRRVRRAATRRDPPLDLPLIDGIQIDLDSLRTRLEPMTGIHTLACFSDPERTANNSGLSALSPFGPMVIAENNGRVAARRAGLALYGAIQIGEPLDAVAYAQSHRSGVRAHPSADGAYYVVTFDLGGPPIPGAMMQARDVGYVGVRGGRVAWKAWEESDRRRIGGGMCLSAELVLGEVRPGCSDTGFYFP